MAMFLLNKPVPWETGYKLVCLQAERIKHLPAEHGWSTVSTEVNSDISYSEIICDFLNTIFLFVFVSL